MFDWLKKHIIFVCVITVAIIGGIPLFINFLFKLNALHPFLVAEWDAGDALGYYGDVLSFIGTVVLSTLALYQNQIIKEESDKKAMELEAKERTSNMPKFAVAGKGSNGNCANLRMEIKNISENPATEIVLYEIKVIAPNHAVFWNCDRMYSFDVIAANSTVDLQLKNKPIPGDGYIFSMMMSCRDKYNDEQYYSVIGEYCSTDFFPKFAVLKLK